MDNKKVLTLTEKHIKALRAVASALPQDLQDQLFEDLPDDEEDHQEESVEAVLKFYLPEHASEFHMATKGPAAFYVLQDILKELRSSLKYQAPFDGMSMLLPPDKDGKELLDSSKDTALETVRDYINRACWEHGVNLDI